MDLIDDAFIDRWRSEFDRLVPDGTGYDDIVRRAQQDVHERKTLSKRTLLAIVSWKSPRIRPIFERHSAGLYSRGISRCLAAPDDEKLAILDELPGVGAPVASAILHFTYPDRFPIIDFRTAGALYELGYLDSPVVSGKNYPLFKKAILDIQRANHRWSLRDIDIALFVYHKFELQKERKNAHRSL